MRIAPAVVLAMIQDWWLVGPGYGYQRWIGCRSGGQCPITTNPHVAIAYGALAGYVATHFG